MSTIQKLTLGFSNTAAPIALAKASSRCRMMSFF